MENKMSLKTNLNKLAEKLITLSFSDEDQKSDDMIFLIPEIENEIAKQYENYLYDLERSDKDSLLFDINYDGSSMHDVFCDLASVLIDLNIDINIDEKMTEEQYLIIRAIDEYFEGFYDYIMYKRVEN